MDQSESESVARAFVQYDHEHGPVVKRILIYNTNHYKKTGGIRYDKFDSTKCWKFYNTLYLCHK